MIAKSLAFHMFGPNLSLQISSLKAFLSRVMSSWFANCHWLANINLWGDLKKNLRRILLFLLIEFFIIKTISLLFIDIQRRIASILNYKTVLPALVLIYAYQWTLKIYVCTCITCQRETKINSSTMKVTHRLTSTWLSTSRLRILSHICCFSEFERIKVCLFQRDNKKK